MREVEGEEVKKWKIAGRTAIPSGYYRVLKTMSSRFGRCTLHIMDVPGYAGIRIHSGNVAANTEGCILPGMTYSKDEVHGSREALTKLESLLFPYLDEHEPVFIAIINGGR